LASQAWDRLTEAREKLAKEGLEYTDSKGVRRPHPAVKIEHDSTIRFSRTLRELDLDISTPGESRPPAIRSSRTVTAIRGGRRAA
jgi:phage terminase small subunit